MFSSIHLKRHISLWVMHGLAGDKKTGQRLTFWEGIKVIVVIVVWNMKQQCR